MNPKQICEYLRGIHWLSDYTFRPEKYSVRWSRGDSSETIYVRQFVYGETKPNYIYDLRPGTGKKHPWVVVLDIIRPGELKIRARKQFFVDTISTLVRCDYTVINSWRARYTKVIFTIDHFITQATFGRRHIKHNNLRRSYRELCFDCIRHCNLMPAVLPGLPLDICECESIESARDKLTRVLIQYKNEFPLLSEKMPIRMESHVPTIAGVYIDIDAPNFRHIREAEIRLQKLQVINTLPQPIAEEIIENLI